MHAFLPHPMRHDGRRHRGHGLRLQQPLRRIGTPPLALLGFFFELGWAFVRSRSGGVVAIALVVAETAWQAAPERRKDD